MCLTCVLVLYLEKKHKVVFDKRSDVLGNIYEVEEDEAGIDEVCIDNVTFEPKKAIDKKKKKSKKTSIA